MAFTIDAKSSAEYKAKIKQPFSGPAVVTSSFKQKIIDLDTTQQPKNYTLNMYLTVKLLKLIGENL